MATEIQEAQPFIRISAHGDNPPKEIGKGILAYKAPGIFSSNADTGKDMIFYFDKNGRRLYGEKEKVLSYLSHTLKIKSIKSNLPSLSVNSKNFRDNEEFVQMMEESKVLKPRINMEDNARTFADLRIVCDHLRTEKRENIKKTSQEKGKRTASPTRKSSKMSLKDKVEKCVESDKFLDITNMDDKGNGTHIATKIKDGRQALAEDESDPLYHVVCDDDSSTLKAQTKLFKKLYAAKAEKREKAEKKTSKKSNESKKERSSKKTSKASSAASDEEAEASEGEKEAVEESEDEEVEVKRSSKKPSEKKAKKTPPPSPKTSKRSSKKKQTPASDEEAPAPSEDESS